MNEIVSRYDEWNEGDLPTAVAYGTFSIDLLIDDSVIVRVMYDLLEG